MDLSETMAIWRSSLFHVVGNAGNERRQQEECQQRAPPGSANRQQEDGDDQLGDWQRHCRGGGQRFRQPESQHGAAGTFQIEQLADAGYEKNDGQYDSCKKENVFHQLPRWDREGNLAGSFETGTELQESSIL